MDETITEHADAREEALDDYERKKIANDLEELRELEKAAVFLEMENRDVKTKVDTLKGELDGINVTLSSTQAYLDSYGDRKARCLASIEEQTPRKEALEKEINDLRMQVIAAKEDEAASGEMRAALEKELEDITSERESVIKRLKGIEEGLIRLDKDKKRLTPHIKSYDQVLKQIYRLFVEAQDRMDVSVILKQK